MTEIVLDASVIWKWLTHEAETGRRPAMALFERLALNELSITVPPILILELLNIAGRRWGWREGALVDLVGRLGRLGLDVLEPDLRDVARWTARGLSSYDASYVALAEERAVELITADRRLVERAPGIARPLMRSAP